MAAPVVTIERVNPLDDPTWDATVETFPQASFFHTSAWARVLQETYRFTPTYFVARNAERVPTAIAPLVEVDSWLTGRRGISLPFTDACAPLVRDPAALRPLFQAISEHGTCRHWRHWELRGGTSALSVPASVAFHGHRLTLHNDTGWLFNRCDSATRRAVRKAEQAGLTVTFAHDEDATRTFHALLCKTRKRLGVPPQPLRFFENIQRHVLARGRGCVVLARQRDVPVAGAVFFHFGNTALFKFGASDETFQQLRPNNLVMWRAIDWHARAGFTVLDLGRTSLDNEGLRRFKLGWGAAEHRIEYARFDLRTAAFVTSTDRSSGWHSGFFKLLPVALARPLGAAAYKHVA